MPFHTHEQVKYFTFPSLEGYSANHAVFTRQGGVSAAPFDSLNVGGTVGDDPASVAENRSRSFKALGRDLASLHDVWQVHSSDVVFADTPRPPETPHVQADILLTGNPQVTLYMRFADCVPILLVDPVKGVVGLAHAGWVGTIKQVAAVAVEAMVSRYGTNPADIRAGIGPSICADHYPVGPEVVEKARQAFGVQADGLFVFSDDHPHFDLWKANQITLERAGVQQIEVSGLCTACHLEDWFSHRGEHGKTGRFGALINLSD
jgi:YfiH family protein